MTLVASVIISTYNSPDWLEKVLHGYFNQNRRDFEIIIADDGSKEDTRERLDSLRDISPVPITHVWQRDDGFRKCRILNKSVLRANSDYLIFTDGDCIPRHDFIDTQMRAAEPGYFVSGGSLLLPMSTSKLITPDDIREQRCFDKQWLYANGLKPTRKILRITAGPKLGAILNRFSPANCNFKGSNAAAWKADVLKVNGFDERMAYGGEDREFGVRLNNIGIKARDVKYSAVLVHLDHAKGYRDPALMASNKALRKRVERERITRTEHGIEQL
ncbi:glycosyltransferase family 2 protein [Pseudohongiella spirulinae]|uniref:Glycosyl transferase family 2 n=1 Tax=Pseudohongiella spirulinae TaxID=1249552 RepID=A0A0S2KEF1_9GAMM|nr:glycosyltransferase family 2 protein [Pseudohongiella spirulinae]ALO46354.1 glycosyl transferase family 2 [Pseudohongiella spirulinae]